MINNNNGNPKNEMTHYKTKIETHRGRVYGMWGMFCAYLHEIYIFCNDSVFVIILLWLNLTKRIWQNSFMLNLHSLTIWITVSDCIYHYFNCVSSFHLSLIIYLLLLVNIFALVSSSFEFISVMKNYGQVIMKRNFTPKMEIMIKAKCYIVVNVAQGF